MKKYLFITLIIFFTGSAHADVLLELGGAYFSDSLGTSSTATSTKYFYNLGVMFSLKKEVWGGWNYSGFSYNDSGTSTTTLSSQDTGPVVKWQFGKGDLFNFSAAYNILSKATYSNGNTNESWQGTSIWLQFAFVPMVKEGFHVGAALNYYAASYTTKTVNNIESTASNTRTWIYPTLLMTKEW
ncbi:MAG: hypothetical protein ACXVCP_09400 [Bdellovibrio sp.]